MFIAYTLSGKALLIIRIHLHPFIAINQEGSLLEAAKGRNIENVIKREFLQSAAYFFSFSITYGD
jgi:hypothetical protein